MVATLQDSLFSGAAVRTGMEGMGSAGRKWTGLGWGRMKTRKDMGDIRRGGKRKVEVMTREERRGVR